MAEAGEKMDPRAVEILALNQRLCACAVNLFKGQNCSGIDSVLPGTGKSPRDLASDTILKLMKSGKWHPGKGEDDIFPLAYVILKNAFLDLVKSLEYKLTVSIDIREGKGLEERSAPERSQQKAEAAALLKFAKHYLGNDEMGKKYLDASQIEGVETRQDYARELNVSVQEVTNIQRRVQYKMHCWERLWKSTGRH